MRNSKPDVFIVESLTFADERADRYEGQIIKKILALSGKEPEYYYIRTARELRKVMEFFARSHYRYLHLSCHGDERSMATTLDELTFPNFAQAVGPYLDERRLFVSACTMTNDSLAAAVMPSGCYSILGPAEDVLFSDAAVLWASLYHVMFAEDTKLMKRAVLETKAHEVADMFRVPLRMYSRDVSLKRRFRALSIAPRVERS